jgi:hypothetical protein
LKGAFQSADTGVTLVLMPPLCWLADTRALHVEKLARQGELCWMRDVAGG